MNLDDDPGWFWYREELPLGPRVIDETTFSRYLDELAPTLGSSDDVLLAASTTIANNDGAGLEEEFLETVGAAAAVTDQHMHDDADATAAELVDAGAGTDVRRAEVQPHIPDPDASIVSGFLALPSMPGPPDAAGTGNNQDPNRD